MSHKVSNVRGCAIEVADGYGYRLVVKSWNGQDEKQHTCIYIYTHTHTHTHTHTQQRIRVDEELLVSFHENNPDETDMTVNSVAYYTGL
jgi:hypothetical protein